ncbi:MAG: hypothetical protein HKN26_14250 [Acidimicrobiales bacterium]|nr:hypothetical protein [Acidimicrobiales bacterium]
MQKTVQKTMQKTMQKTLIPRVVMALFALTLVASACGSDADEPDATTTSADPGEPIGVEDLFDGEGAREAVVEGFVVWDQQGARLCAVLMESFPPQCGNPAVVIANPDDLTVELQSEQGVRWTDGIVALDGRFDGDRFILAVDA